MKLYLPKHPTYHLDFFEIKELLSHSEGDAWEALINHYEQVGTSTGLPVSDVPPPDIRHMDTPMDDEEVFMQLGWRVVEVKLEGL